MNRWISTLVLAALVAAGACSRSGNKAADTALNSDLSLAAQQRNAQQLDSIATAERVQANALNSTQPVHRTEPSSDVHHTVHHHSVASSSSTTTTTSNGTVVKHTERDAAIGAAAGAVLGATTSRSKVKGGIIGAAVGGLLGGVVGNNVDKQKKP